MNYDANSIETLDFTTAIRKRIEMYMGSADNQGVLQCIREVISNSIDEFSIGYGDKIEITVDTEKNIFTCRDYARSIPFGKRADGSEAMIATFMQPHTGGKFSDKQYGNAVIGQNGIGIKGVALSAEDFRACSYRNGQCATLTLHRGQKIQYDVVQSSEKQGTFISFSPSPDVYRLEEIYMSFQDICQMCEDWSYLNKGLTFILTDVVNNKTVTYYSKNGIADFIKAKVTSTIQKEPFTYYVEDNEGNKMEIGFLWGSKNELSYVFTNGLHNLNGGTSLTGAKTAITRTMNNLAGDKFTGDFVRNNLCYVINAKVPHASFSDQTKMRINNGALRPLGDKAFSEGLKQFAQIHREEFDKVVALLTRINKAEIAADHAREAILNHEKKEAEHKKQKITSSDKFKDCEKHGQDSMLIICEGNSALGGLMPARDVNTEALYAVRGKIKNLLKHSLDECLENQEVSDIIMALGCGIQNKYNSKKLNYGKVAMAVDGDVDGKNIMCLIATMFFVLMPDFIKEDRLCWLRAPLYKLEKGNQKLFAYTDDELKELRIGHEKWDITRAKGLGELSAEDMEQSMLHPTHRRLEVLSISDAEAAAESITMLMGTEVSERRDFLFENVDFSKINN